jgi:hypothetical protein
MNKAKDSREKTPPIIVGKKPGPGESKGPIPIFSPPQMKPTPTRSQTRLLWVSSLLISRPVLRALELKVALKGGVTRRMSES